MSRVGRCIDNGPMEGFWGILKRECYYGQTFTSREQLVSTIEDYIASMIPSTPCSYKKNKEPLFFLKYQTDIAGISKIRFTRPAISLIISTAVLKQLQHSHISKGGFPVWDNGKVRSSKITWKSTGHDYASASKGVPITEAGLVEKASVIGRTGLMLLECGTGAWRVRSSMNTLSRELGVTTTADIGLLSIEFTCFDGDQCYTQSLCLTNTGVNTSRLNRLEHFVNDFDREGKFMTGEELHSHLDEIERIHGLYSPIALGFAAALACGCFTFLLGGGIVEMLCAFCGAGIGNFVRCKLTKHHFTLFLGITASVCSASLVYAILLKLAEVLFAVSAQHEAGYICSMLFIIPGFPFITSGIDLAKLDMRSGLERLAYAILIILVATMTAWIMALLLHLQPVQFPALSLTLPEEIVFRLLASFWRCVRLFAHVQQSRNLAVCAALIGAVTNTFRLELVSLAGFPPAVAAFLGALLSGLLASCLKSAAGYPRISVTVPSIVIMVPGLYFYRAIYNLGILSLMDSATWFADAILIIVALPLGLIFARIVTDKTFRYCT